MAQRGYVEEKNRRKQALRSLRRFQRQADSSIERIERRIVALSNRKTIITREAAMSLAPLWNDFIRNVRSFETGFADFLAIVNV